jgi:hypothetical protein
MEGKKPWLMKTTDLAKGQRGYFNLQAENSTDFNSISTDDMDRPFVNNEIYIYYFL